MRSAKKNTQEKPIPIRKKTCSSQRKKMVVEANKLHGEILAAEADNLQKAITIGGYLVKLRKQFPYGTWLKWRNENFDFSSRTAGRYVKLYKYRDIVKDAKSIREGMRIVNALEGGSLVMPEPQDEDKTKCSTCACFQITVTRNSPEKLVDDCSSLYSQTYGADESERFLAGVADYIQHLGE